MLKTPSVMSSLRCARADPQDLARGVDVLVREHLDRRAAQAAAVDDARVVELVEMTRLLGQDRRDRAGVRREAALEDDRRLRVLERARRRSSSMWIAIVPAIVRTEPEPTPNSRSPRSRAECRVRREPEIVVRRQLTTDGRRSRRRLLASSRTEAEGS
jgi:hypothetical protein